MAKAWKWWALGVCGAVWAGCVMEQTQCACTEEFRSFGIVVRDADGPVDSARVRIFRVSDDKELSHDTTWLPNPDKGHVVAFSDNNLKDIPANARTMEIRVVATRGAKTGEERMTLGTQECRCHVEKVAGKDTVLIK